MITQLYVFSPSSYVVAEEWNANFRVVYNTNVLHEEAITDAQNIIAFSGGDLTGVFVAVNNQSNSFVIPGNTVSVLPECEYYKTLSSGEDLTINIPNGFSSEARIILKTQEDRTILPFTVTFSGSTQISYGEDLVFPTGTYFILIYELNGIAQVKLIWTGA